MLPIILRHTRLSRRLALLAGALLLRSRPVLAEHNDT
jgi:hypothetical protein